MGNCRAAQNYSICVSNLFAQCEPDVRWWACENIRIGFSLSGCREARCTVGIRLFYANLGQTYVTKHFAFQGTGTDTANVRWIQ